MLCMRVPQDHKITHRIANPQSESALNFADQTNLLASPIPETTFPPGFVLESGVNEFARENGAVLVR
jgi:hypothetical protein